MLEFRKDILAKIQKREKEKKKLMSIPPESGEYQEFEVNEKGDLVPIRKKSEKEKILEAEFNEEWEQIEKEHAKAKKEEKETEEAEEKLRKLDRENQ